MDKSWRPVLKASVMALAVILVFSTLIRAGRSVIDDVTITEEFDCTRIAVKFSFPVRYVNHFPGGSGEDLRIQLEPIITRALDSEGLFSREEPLLPPGAFDPLVELVYEGKIDGGPYLTLYFDREMEFKVEQGADFRSILVTVSDPGRPKPGPSAP